MQHGQPSDGFISVSGIGRYGAYFTLQNIFIRYPEFSRGIFSRGIFRFRYPRRYPIGGSRAGHP